MILEDILAFYDSNEIEQYATLVCIASLMVNARLNLQSLYCFELAGVECETISPRVALLQMRTNEQVAGGAGITVTETTWSVSRTNRTKSSGTIFSKLGKSKSLPVLFGKSATM